MFSIGTRRYAVTIAAPLDARMKTRLSRAVAQALTQPARAMPTLRRTVLAATAQLRASGFTTERVQLVFDTLIEDVARARSLDGTSIVSGNPRWVDLTSRVRDWISLAESPG